MRFHERLQALRTEVEELLAFFLLLLLREAIFRLGDLKFALPFKSDETDTQVGAA